MIKFICQNGLIYNFMKVLMISLEKTLVGEKQSGGDSAERHKRYGEFCDILNIIVMCNKGHQDQKLSDKVFVRPTNSKFKFLFLFDAIKMAKKIHQNDPFDLVVCQDSGSLAGWRLKKKLKTKFLINIHGDILFNKGNKDWQNAKWFNRLLVLFLKISIKSADGIRVVSNGLKNKLVKAGINENKIKIISVPIDLEKFTTFNKARIDELKQKYHFKNILWDGRLEAEKNLGWFLEVFKWVKKEYNNVNFIMIGNGSLRKRLENKAQELKLKDSVHFIGQVDHSDLTNYYHISNIYVFPSLAESFGKVLVQAGAAGLPSVASATTGAQEIIQDNQTGFIVPINNKEKTIEKIMTLLKNEKLAKQMGEKAKQYVQENFDGEVNTQKIIQLWQELSK